MDIEVGRKGPISRITLQRPSTVGSILAIALAACFLLLGSGCGNSAGDPPEAVFLGSSTTSNWDLVQSFPVKNYVNKGVIRNDTSDMLARFQPDVINLKPAVVVIWAGENDIQHGVALSTTQANISAMLQKASAAGIRVVFCTVQPKKGSAAVQNPAIEDFNQWLTTFAADNGAKVADYYSVLVDSSGNLTTQYAAAGSNEELSADGYAAITPVAAAAIAAAEQ